MDKVLLGVKEAGAAIGLSPWTIRKMIRESRLDAVRLGRRVLVEPAALRRLVERAKRKSAPRPTA